MLSKNEIKYIQSLSQKKFRAEHGRFVAEGPKVVEDLLQTTRQLVVGIYALDEWTETNRGRLTGITVHTITSIELEKISQLQTPQQVLAVVEFPPETAPIIPATAWSLALDGVQDPGNLGTIIRTADWFGITHIFCSPDTVDCFNPKVVQASMGSLFRVQVHYTSLDRLFAETHVPVYGTLLNGANVFALQQPAPGVILIGNEGRGIREHLQGSITQPVTIPRKGGAESLNAAVAAAIVVSRFVGE